MAFSPDIFEEDANLGLENLGQDDLALPFLKLLSRQDPVLDDLENAKAGDILNTVSNQVYSGKTGIRVIPCAYQRRFIEWAPRGTGSGAPVNIYTPEDTLPKVERDSTDNKDYVVGAPGVSGGNPPALRGDFRGGRHHDYGANSNEIHAVEEEPSLEQHLAQRPDGQERSLHTPRFGHIYVLKTVSEENSKGSWHGWDISLEGVVENGAHYKQAKEFSESILRGDVEVKHTEDGAGAGTTHRFRKSGLRPPLFGV